MKSKRTIFVIVIIGALIVVLACGAMFVYKKATHSSWGLIVAGKNISSDTLVENLSSKDRDLVMTSLYLLKERSDSAGKQESQKLLLSPDDYIWFNAAQYLAEIQDEQAVPYLIKGLKHPAWRSHADVAAYLERITDERYGKNQAKWIEWWQQANPDKDFDFEYQNLKKKALELSSSSHILINGVLDPLRISHCGPQIRLIGVKLKKNADPEKAISILKQSVLFQFVQLEFDSGDKLDDEGARLALVYWTREGEIALFMHGRKGLPSVPFNKRTLVNTFLLQSGFYEIDLKDVNDPKIRAKVEGAIK